MESMANIKDVFFESKKYILVYLIFILLTFLSTITLRNFQNPKLELASFVLVAVLGIFCIVFYFLHNDDNELFKVAFVAILCFGIVCSFVVPILDVSDELEHMTRAEITSRGEIFAHWTGDDVGIDRLYKLGDGKWEDRRNPNVGFETIQSVCSLGHDRGLTVQESLRDRWDINNTIVLRGSAFEQNPFFGYLPQAVGIFIAKLLDLNIIWMLWLGRICNLICYAGLVSLAIRKTPYLKLPLFAVACIPIAIYQAASMSIDSMIIGLGILAVAYFIYMIKSDNPITNRDLVFYTVICIILGLCKLPYLAFIFLLLFIPSERINNSEVSRWYIILAIVLVAIIGIAWSRYSTPTLMHSWRSRMSNVDSARQLTYLMGHPNQIFKFFHQIFNHDLKMVVNGLFNFYNGRGTSKTHYTDHYNFITIMLQIFLGIVLFTGADTKFELRTKVGSLLVVILIYVSTCFIQLLTWANVGAMKLDVTMRYFIPLLALIPVIVQLNHCTTADKRFKDYSVILIIGFMATIIMAFATKYY